MKAKPLKPIFRSVGTICGFVSENVQGTNLQPCLQVFHFKMVQHDTCGYPPPPPKTNMATQNDGLEKVTPALNMAILGIYVLFLGCITRDNNHHPRLLLTYDSYDPSRPRPITPIACQSVLSFHTGPLCWSWKNFSSNMGVEPYGFS